MKLVCVLVSIMIIISLMFFDCGKKKKSNNMSSDQQELIEYNNSLVREESWMSSKIQAAISDIQNINEIIAKDLSSPTQHPKSIWEHLADHFQKNKEKIIKSKSVIEDKSPSNKAKDLHQSYIQYYSEIISAFESIEKAMSSKKNDYTKERDSFFEKVSSAQTKLKQAQSAYFSQNGLQYQNEK